MRKPWSITTTVRNPLRIKDFLKVAVELEDRIWDHECQGDFQKKLIQKRLYGYGKSQFYNNLPKDIIDVINNQDASISSSLVDRIVRLKNYKGPGLDGRGRTSMSVLTMFGFVRIEGLTKKIIITKSGKELLNAPDDKVGEIVLRSFLKWQIPNPINDDYPNDGSYASVPFVLSLKLIDTVNKKEVERGNKPIGLQKREFALFATSLTHFKDIERYAKAVLNFRDEQKNKNGVERKRFRDAYRVEYAKNFLNTDKKKDIDKFLSNIKDYGDSAIRYFRLTNFIRVRGGGFYVDIEPSRLTEINALFESEWYKPRNFDSRDAYLDYLCSNVEPKYPWETEEKLREIAIRIQDDITRLAREVGEIVSITAFNGLSSEELKLAIENLRKTRNELRNKDDHVKAQPTEYITQCIQQFDDIYDPKKSEKESRALRLERLSTMALHAFNDAISVKPNYPIGDDNEPTSTAPGGVPDIECLYSSFSMVCEVTMLKDRSQWFNEGQPVMRHLRDFEDKHDNSYCLFIAPSIHADTAETFYISNNHGYKRQRQKIAPITISQFISMLQCLKQMRENGKAFHSSDMKELLDKIVEKSTSGNDSEQWLAAIPQVIADWQNSLLG